jgi:DNA polymerase-1
MVRIGPAEVRERYGVEPHQVPDFIALRGDSSDKLPGAPGVGPKGAADLLRKYGTLEVALKAGRFAAQAEALRLYRSIATMGFESTVASAARPETDVGQSRHIGAPLGAEGAAGQTRQFGPD